MIEYQNLYEKKEKKILKKNIPKIPKNENNSKNRNLICKIEQMDIFLKSEKNFFEKYLSGKNDSKNGFLNGIRNSLVTTGILEEKIDEKRAIVTTNSGLEFYVEICSFVDTETLSIGDIVLLHEKSFSIVGFLKEKTNLIVDLMKIQLAPSEDYESIGGLKHQIQEIKEVIELPLTHPEIFSKIGIVPPKGVILYGKPGTGKTLLAKAVANKTKASFFRVAGSELVQKFLGEGPKLVREIFHSASSFNPSIIFIDEIDAIGTARYSAFSGGEKEIQRTMLELLNQLDGFDPKENLKVILATNRIDSLDPALIRPGRIDRKIEFPFPDKKTLVEILKIHTKKMKINENVNLKTLLLEKNNFSGADIRAICTEAALIALRFHRIKIESKDLIKACNFILNKKKEKFKEILYI